MGSPRYEWLLTQAVINSGGKLSRLPSSCKTFASTTVLSSFAMSENLALEKIAPLIHEVHGQRVILDSDLAGIYGVSAKRLNQAVKRNASRFPEDFAFRLTRSEFDSLRSQFVTSDKTAVNRSQFVTGSQKHRNPRYPPFAFTEHGAIMAATVLNSKQAIEMSVFVVRAFVRMREMLAKNRQLAAKINELDRCLETHDTAIQDIIEAIKELMVPEGPSKRKIGFQLPPAKS